MDQNRNSQRHGGGDSIQINILGEVLPGSYILQQDNQSIPFKKLDKIIDEFENLVGLQVVVELFVVDVKQG